VFLDVLESVNLLMSNKVLHLRRARLCVCVCVCACVCVCVCVCPTVGKTRAV